MVRTAKEILSDRLLLLWLLYDAMRYKRFGDIKAQKLTYLSEQTMIERSEKGFNYNFIKLQYGPYSDDLQKDIVWLEKSQFIESTPYDEGKLFYESGLGKKLLDDFNDLFVRNSAFIGTIKEVNNSFAPKNSKEIVDEVHRLPHPYFRNRTIDDLKLGTTILCKLDDEKARTKFTISPEELATLDIYLDDNSYRSVIEASESAKKKPLLSFEEVF